MLAGASVVTLSAIAFNSLTLSSPAGAQPSATLSVSVALSGTRVNAADQFTVAVASGSAQGPVVNQTSASTTFGTGAGVSPGSGTTGLVSVNAGTAYYVSESAVDGANVLSTYAAAISCSDANGVQSGLPTGAPLSGPIDITPMAGAAITCVITNTAPTPTPGPAPSSPAVGSTSAPTLTVVAALSGPRAASSDQFTVAIQSGATSGAVINSTNNSTTAGTGAIVFPGTGTTGAVGVAASSPYAVTESAADGTNLSAYSRTVTCVDANGIESGLPAGAGFSGGLTISLVGGANVTCTITADAIGIASGTASTQSDAALAPHALPKAIACTVSTAWLAQTSGGPTTLYNQTFGTGAVSFTNLGQASADPFNALGEDPSDGYLYGIDANNNHLLEINPTTGLQDNSFALAPGLKGDINVGAFDTSGNYYVAANTASTLYDVNVSTHTTATINLSQKIVASDLTYDDGYLWGGTGNEAPVNKIVRVNPSNGSVYYFDPPAGMPTDAGSIFGGAFTYGNGDIGLDNNEGGLYQLSITNPGGSPTFSLINHFPAPASSGNDAASCISPPTDLKIVKSGPAKVFNGGTMTWTLAVTNKGPSESSGYVVTDAVPSGYTNISGTPGCTLSGNTLTCTNGTLAIGATDTITVTATAPGALGCLTNTTTVLGNEGVPTGDEADTTSSLKTCVVQSIPTLDLSKLLAGARVDPGDQFTMSLHTGSATGPVVNDATNSTTAGAGSAITAGSGTTGVFNATAGTAYFLTEDPAGGADLTNYTATITCVDANGYQTGLPTNAAFSGSVEITPVTGAAIACNLTNHPLAPGVSIQKQAAVTPGSDSGGAQVGDTISYSYIVTNSGNDLMKSVAVDDPTEGSVSCPTPAAPGLAPGASVTCTADATYTVTQNDVDAGSVSDTATATGIDYLDNPTPVSLPDTAVVPTVLENEQVSVHKQAQVDPATDQTAARVGDTISYSYKVTNTGTVDLDPVTVTDPMPGLSAISCPVEALAPKAVETCTATYTTTLADVTGGKATNIGTATGTNLKDQTTTGVSQQSSTVVVPYVDPPVSAESPLALTHVAVTG